MLTPTQISLVQGSFAQVAAIADAAAQMFYRRLFELDPTLSRLFKGDMKQQGWLRRTPRTLRHRRRRLAVDAG